ncbi:Discs large homolog 1-like protein [Strongyloides ratti]|uniref:Discs large homolog 1-like protein n=1 Tax=Strongyloides ratti TaxID=34506 RepID=A0A090LKP2_STRRB|nr:Discs large homolog 1-like protein [Strongyloides ratti]CEF68708.1 Discs large homolog 1-like protein [Strongyloides ratti]
MVFNYKKVVHLSEVYKVLNELEKFQSINKNVELNFAIEKLTKKFRKNLIKALIDINDLYNGTLMNNEKTYHQKVDEANFVTLNLFKENIEEEKIEHIVFEKGQTGLGLSITGGLDQPIAPNDSHIYVTNITPDGAVANDGRMEVFDIILKVNNIDITSVPHSVAVKALKDSGNIVKLDVKKNNNFNNKKNQIMNISESLINGSKKEERIKKVVFHKSSEGLGFSITGGIGNEHIPGDNGIYITRIIEGGAASLDGRIKVGDKIISVDGVSLQNVSHDFAVKTLKSTGNKVTLRYCSNNSLVTQSYNSCSTENNQPRSLTLIKNNQGLGFNIVGGEDGEPIFISHVLPGGVADQSGGHIQKGDVLLEVNGISLEHSSHSEAAQTLKNSLNPVNLTLQYRPNEYEAFEKKLEQLRNDMILVGNNSKYLEEIVSEGEVFVKALFDNDFSSPQNRMLPFQYGDILHLISVNENDDWWSAEKVNFSGESISEKGLIPSKKKVEKKEKQRRRKEFNNNKKMNYNLEVKKKFSKDSYWKEVRRHREDYTGTDFTTTEDDSDSDRYSLTQNETIFTYQTVKLHHITYKRPVVILGILKDRIIDELVTKYSDNFALSIPHTSRLPRENEVDGKDYYFVSKEQMERDVKSNNIFIEAGQFQNNLYGTSIASIIDVANTGKHCILDVSGNAIKRLETQANIHPIAIFVRPKNFYQLIEWDVSLLEEDAKEIYKRILKIEKTFKDHFTTIITGPSFDNILEKIKEVIYYNSQSYAWIPTKNIKF